MIPKTMKHLFAAAGMLLSAAAITGCDNIGTSSNPNTNSGNVSSYVGPPPATADVNAFMTNFWAPLKGNNRCGACHGAGGQTPNFVRQDNINTAYSEAIQIVDLASPADSKVVAKVGGGHNCWLDSNDACAAVLTAYIEAWAGSGAGTSAKQIALTAPPIKDAGASRSFPETSGLFNSTVYPLLSSHCSACHSPSAATPQAPFFAASDVDAAYEAIKTSHKMDLDNPPNSRIVVRLRNEFHNCWSGDCAADATALENAVYAFAGLVPVTTLDPDLVTSKALNLFDGIVASGGSRHESNLIALYEFKTGQGGTVYDTSGVEPALNLQLSGTEGVDYKWVGGWGVEFISGRAQGTTTSSKKLYDMIRASGEYSIEAWAVPANVTQEGPARIVSYSGGVNARNFTLGQVMYNYVFQHRSSTTDGDGEPALSTADDDEDLQATQQHVVVTFDPVNGRRIYVNGVFTDDADETAPGNLADWDDSFAFVLGNEVGGMRQWQGKLRMVAVHNRALTPEQIAQNFTAGVGEKFFLLFNVSDVTDVPDSYIMFEVSQFDDYSYLFNRPTFVSLDPNASPDGVPLKGMRIGINGKEASVGQAYRNLDLTLGGSAYTPASGQLLSGLGTVIALEKGAQNDEFFLTFEVLGDESNVVIEPAPLTPAPVDKPARPDIGLRTFEEISAAMSTVTGVGTTQSGVKTTFETVKQQLPTAEDIEGFLSAHQVAVAQLSIEYCNALVEDTTLRASFFPGLNFNASAATAFGTTAGRDLMFDPLLNNIMGTGLTTQPAPADVKTELNNLVGKLTTNGATTPTVVKATCSAVLGSAVTLLQ